jgi:ubiquinone/menaquinone biosynthesis C-methylase UbiE
VVDIGAGECKWNILFSDCLYVGIDKGVGDKTCNYSHLDCIADVHSLPVRDSTFDLALCIAVLGHVRDPQRVIGEAFRVLKPGGIFFAMSEFAKAEHQAPYDFTRLTRYALLDYACKAGFVNPQVMGSNSFGTSILNLIESYAWKVSANGFSKVFRLLIRMFIRIRVFDFFYTLVKDRSGSDIFPIYFLLKCEKPHVVYQGLTSGSNNLNNDLPTNNPC